MKKISLCDTDWRLYYVKNERLCHDNRQSGAVPKTEAELVERCYDNVSATVPGNLEIDLFRSGVIGDPFYALNPLDRSCEYLHMFYVKHFRAEEKMNEAEFCFEGLDTVAEIFLNGKLIGETDNMLIPHIIGNGGALLVGENELVVHITPAVIAARAYRIHPSNSALPYNFESLYIRKAAHMYSWDIMPRMVSGGIWRPLTLRERKAEGFSEDDVCINTCNINVEKKTAILNLNYNVDVLGDDISEYEMELCGVCGDSEIHWKSRLWNTGGNVQINCTDVRFWWPRNMGAAELYDVTLTLYRNGKTVDVCKKTLGIRTVKLIRTSVTDEQGNGDFRFIINGKPVFAMGSNWVPADALHSRDAERIPKILPMLSDIGCNIIRIWGGGVYEDDRLYDYCDRDGIMIWQDFMMACGSYPQDGLFCKKIENEVETIVKRLRGHASIVLWAGDNENDSCGSAPGGMMRDPNKVFKVTRKVIPDVLDKLDHYRPYIPSSPYIDEEAFKNGGHNISEDHLWGPRDYFKGNYYANSVCHFASETGYHGCPSPSSLKRYLTPEKLLTARNSEDWSGIDNDEWLAHATAQETAKNAAYVYRIRLMADQVTTLFGSSVPCTLDDFSRASQISQAEAKKYFIERFRLSKWRRTGIIWWNLMDGWPQISDAVVDYYFTKKLAYNYIKRSQATLCLMFDEPKGHVLPLHAVNDGEKAQTFEYAVTELGSGKVVACGEYTVSPDSSEVIANVPIEEGEKKFYHIAWKNGESYGSNHYMTNIKDIDYTEYLGYINKCGYDEWEGFDE